MIDQKNIEQVKARMDVVEVVSDHVKLKLEGGNLVGYCPFHDEKSPSFKVSKSKQIYKCFGCGKSGDAISFIQEYLKLNYLDAIKSIAAKYHIELLEATQTKRPTIRPASQKLPLTMSQYDWFKSRGIERSTLEEFKITNATEWMPKAKKEVDTVCFNYFLNGELVNVKYRAENKDFKLVKDAELVFYNIDSIKGRDYVVITEGEIDCLSVKQSGAKAVVSVPNGAAKGVQKLDYLETCFDLFRDVKTIVLFTDNDEPGITLRDELARRFGYERCFLVEYPEGCKDANDVLLSHGKEMIGSMLARATEFPMEGIISMSDMYGDIKKFYTHGYPQGAKVGIPEFDEYISFMLGQFTTITGIPGSGKSEFTDYMMMQAAKTHGWSFGVCSFENQPSSLHATKLMEKYAGKSFANRFNPYDRMSSSQFDEAIKFVEDHFHFINLSQVEVTLEGILAKARELVGRRDIKGLLIDPWNYLEHKLGEKSETQYINECLTTLKAFALTNKIHIFLIAHPTKLQKEGGKYVVPTLYNISGSAHFFNKTDNGITVYRNFDSNTVDVYIQKVRYSWLGKLGFCSFVYNTDTRQYEGKSKPQKPDEPPDNPSAGIRKTIEQTKKEIDNPF